MLTNEGFGATRRTPRHFMHNSIGFLEFGDNARDNNPFRERQNGEYGVAEFEVGYRLISNWKPQADDR
jgi:hypothetical protein